MKHSLTTTRRDFIRLSGLAGAAIGFPTIIPSRVLGADAPSKKINILQIGCGRIARDMDMPGILKQSAARMVAACDLDSIRANDAKEMIEGHYKKNKIDLTVKTYGDYREALQHPDIDAVAVSTPDFWHAEPVIAAALAGKDIYVQKPLSMTLAEGRAVSDIVTARKRIFQIGSQQRSGAQFRIACEMVRNGRIGKLHTVRIGLLTDPSGGSTDVIPVPPNLNFEMWLGCTPLAPYTKDRTHPQGPDLKSRYGERPGWLRIEDYTLGMITGWGSHHVDIAHWGMDTEHTGPLSITGKAEFPQTGLWNVHGPYHIEATYANGVTMIIDSTFPNGIRFDGSDGWIFVSRGAEHVTASDPIPKGGAAKALMASKPEILSTPLGDKEIHLHESPNGDHHLDWITAMQARKPAATMPEIAHRSTSACIVSWVAMKLGRKLTWNPEKEEFTGDDTANAMRSRPQRAPYGISNMHQG